MKGVKVSRLSGTDSVVGQRGKFEFYALLSRMQMKVFKIKILLHLDLRLKCLKRHLLKN